MERMVPVSTIQVSPVGRSVLAPYVLGFHRHHAFQPDTSTEVNVSVISALSVTVVVNPYCSASDALYIHSIPSQSHEARTNQPAPPIIVQYAYGPSNVIGLHRNTGVPPSGQPAPKNLVQCMHEHRNLSEPHHDRSQFYTLGQHGGIVG